MSVEPSGKGLCARVCVLGCGQLFVIVACPTPLSMGVSRQEHWSGLPFPSPGDLPNPGIQPGAPALQEDSLPAKLPGKPHTLPTGVQSNPT